MLVALYPFTMQMLPASFMLGERMFTNTGVFITLAAGLIAGLAIGLITEYFTSHRYSPVREVADVLRVSPLTIKRWGKRGKLPAIRINSRGDRRYKKEAVLWLLGMQSKDE